MNQSEDPYTPVRSIDLAVEEKIRQAMIDGRYATIDNAKSIAKDASREIYESFYADIAELREELNRQGERQDRLWDNIFKPKSLPVKSFWKKLSGWLVFWNKA